MRAGPSRRFVLLCLAVACLVTIFYLGSIRHSGGGVANSLAMPKPGPAYQTTDEVTLTGHVIAPKLANETAK